MPSTKRKQPNTSLTEARVEVLLSAQSSVILRALDERFTTQKVEILTAVDRRLEQMEERFNRKLDRLTNTLDRFLKRLTDVEEEFTFMKNDVNRIKAVLREKLGVSID